MLVLRDEKSAEGSRFLSAEVKANGDLLISGLDYGPGVYEILGEQEYEWYWTVKVEHVGLLVDAMAGEGDVLSLLKTHFMNDQAAGLHEFLIKNEIPYESWSRMGD